MVPMHRSRPSPNQEQEPCGCVGPCQSGPRWPNGLLAAEGEVYVFRITRIMRQLNFNARTLLPFTDFTPELHVGTISIGLRLTHDQEVRISLHAIKDLMRLPR